MEVEAARYIAKGMFVLSMMGSAIGEGWLMAKGMEAMGRNPAIADSMFPKMIVGAAIVESTAIYAFVAFFIA
ncbi:MAG: ATP synthase F0 subunit C [Candidatus Magasanikbacteria bacterium]|jgi:F0F1-type ATP synthase membrane subunit c/vacuolar-type H+-ATPase subunit K|nr:ATP synthase F0 subunit C [Candidatus Magasanikbacteria bacterium]